jgi:hypothetical protein
MALTLRSLFLMRLTVEWQTSENALRIHSSPQLNKMPFSFSRATVRITMVCIDPVIDIASNEVFGNLPLTAVLKAGCSFAIEIETIIPEAKAWPTIPVRSGFI